jgi:protein associated with RNAse G/E
MHEHVSVVSRKHDGSFHRLWKKGWVVQREPLVIRVDAGEHVVEADGREWWSPFPVFLWFHPSLWFNVMILCKEEGTGYYCNIASPPCFDAIEQRYVFVDYDLDVRVETDGSFQVVDRDEYLANAKRFGYPVEVKTRVNAGLEELLKRLQEKQVPFTNEFREMLGQIRH